MRALTGELLLGVWDEGTPEHDLDRAITMLKWALPDSSRNQVSAMPLAERDVQLLRLRELTFGPVMRGFGVCSRCGARLEYSLPVAPMIAHAMAQLPNAAMEWTEDGRQYRLRPVNSEDLIASLGIEDVNVAAEFVLTRCLEPAGSSACAREKFERLNAAADLDCAIECPDCGQVETLDLDIGRFLWQEVRHAARELLRNIHELASAYGWSEESIARMSPQRRSAYMEMLRA